MRRIFLLLIQILIIAEVYGQKKEKREFYPQKFYKVSNKIYGIKTLKRFPQADLYSLSVGQNEKPQWIFPPQGIIVLSSYYKNLRWDIDKDFYIHMLYNRSIEMGGDYNDITFREVHRFLQLQDEILKDDYDPNKYTLSHNLTGIRDFFFRMMMGKENPKGYWCYDLVLCEDETLLMPVMFADSLYLYRYTDKAWTKPDYPGAEKNRENDKWTRTGQALCPFKTDFRAFQIEEDLYFLADADTMLYKYENAGIREIGRIKPTESERTLFLVDKDDRKVYFLMAQSIDIIPEEGERFALLGKEDELYKAVKRIIDEPDRK